jgi:hypothetical protein
LLLAAGTIITVMALLIPASKRTPTLSTRVRMAVFGSASRDRDAPKVIRALWIVLVLCLTGCAAPVERTGDPGAAGAARPAAPGTGLPVDDAVTAAVALQVGRGAADQRLAGSLEEACLRQFPSGQWLPADRRVDLLIDLSIHDVRQEEKPFQ